MVATSSEQQSQGTTGHIGGSGSSHPSPVIVRKVMLPNHGFHWAWRLDFRVIGLRPIDKPDRVSLSVIFMQTIPGLGFRGQHLCTGGFRVHKDECEGSLHTRPVHPDGKSLLSTTALFALQRSRYFPKP